MCFSDNVFEMMVTSYNPLDDEDHFKTLDTTLVGPADVALFHDIDHAYANQSTIDFILTKHPVSLNEPLRVEVFLGGSETILLNKDNLADEINRAYQGI